MTHRFTISTLTTLDPVLRSAVAMNLALDRGDTVVIHHDLVEDGIRRVVSDAFGIIESTTTELEHTCLSCAIREDLIPALAHLQEQDRWARALVALPATAESAPLTRALHDAARRRGPLEGARLGAVVCAVDADTVADDAFSDDFLTDLGRELIEGDERVLAEALAPMVAHADLVALVSDGAVSEQARATVDHLRGRGSVVLESAAEELDGERVMSTEHRCDRALGRIDPLRVDRHIAEDRAGVWTVELTTDRAFHPERLREHIRDLGGHAVRTRGHFWIPSRPTEACAWDGAGRQVSVGSVGRWGRHPRGTRIVATGRGHERAEIEAAFRDSLVLPGERVGATAAAHDALEDWLGPKS
ncbi:CobW family GTP-binding protein [Demequina maris]|uniref:CobW family GTP-binding protein n=1 Tax=Demequina maris TaxID=1638982 RepID=UPI0007825D73|nr:GTP-binding protein [Demequina maris]